MRSSLRAPSMASIPAFEGRRLGDKEHIPFFLNKVLDCVLPRTPITANLVDMAVRLRYRGLS
jgi:hypothetical protein